MDFNTSLVLMIAILAACIVLTSWSLTVRYIWSDKVKIARMKYNATKPLDESDKLA